jgi:hypothetical protein
VSDYSVGDSDFRGYDGIVKSVQSHPSFRFCIVLVRVGYLKHRSAYKSAVQDAPNIKVGEMGADGVDLSGKVVVITGANSGIGKDLAIYAAAKNAKLYMFCRSRDRAEEAKEAIVKATNNSSVEIILIDLVRLAITKSPEIWSHFGISFTFAMTLTIFLPLIFFLSGRDGISEESCGGVAV